MNFNYKYNKKVIKIDNKIKTLMLENFLHNIAGKINLCGLLLETNGDLEVIKKNVKILEVLLIFYRSVLLDNQEIQISEEGIQDLFIEKKVTFICNDLSHFIKKKALLLCLFYNSTINTNIIILNNNNVILQDRNLEFLMNFEKKNLQNLKMLCNYSRQEDKIIFHLS